ncbi:MAG TPA: hypothetical protein VFD13_07875 [Candidatus Kapabacteria bacterium]|nr:hypothetical protein [Candidatus Kapabacteria bacterium]
MILSAGMAGLLFAGCAPSAHFNSSQPRIAVHGADWRSVSVAITEYNLSKGRKLDLATPNELVLYDAAASIVGDTSPDGAEKITCKTVYCYTFLSDSVIIASHRFQTSDLDDTTSAEADDSATYLAEQQELSEIAKRIEQPASHGGLATPGPSR